VKQNQTKADVTAKAKRGILDVRKQRNSASQYKWSRLMSPSPPPLYSILCGLMLPSSVFLRYSNMTKTKSHKNPESVNKYDFSQRRMKQSQNSKIK
jgi:hypothetical protein